MSHGRRMQHALLVPGRALEPPASMVVPALLLMVLVEMETMATLHYRRRRPPLLDHVEQAALLTICGSPWEADCGSRSLGISTTVLTTTFAEQLRAITVGQLVGE